MWKTIGDDSSDSKNDNDGNDDDDDDGNENSLMIERQEVPNSGGSSAIRSAVGSGGGDRVSGKGSKDITFIVVGSSCYKNIMGWVGRTRRKNLLSSALILVGRNG